MTSSTGEEHSMAPRCFKKFLIFTFPNLRQAHKIEIITIEFCQKIDKSIVSRHTLQILGHHMQDYELWLWIGWHCRCGHIPQACPSTVGFPISFRRLWRWRGQVLLQVLHLRDHGVVYGYTSVCATIAWCSIENLHSPGFLQSFDKRVDWTSATEVSCGLTICRFFLAACQTFGGNNAGGGWSGKVFGRCRIEAKCF